jgi:uroporphyrinogen decarboxylase
MSMTPRERVLAVMNHEEPDRVPIVLGVSNATGIKMKPYQELKKILGIEAEDRYIYDWPELGTADPDEETMLRLHSDIRGVWDREPQSTMERNLAREPHSPCIDSWGSGQVEISPGEWFPGVHPMADATTLEEIESYPWPDMMDPTRLAGVREKAKRLADENRFAILATPWLLFPFERSFAMQGMVRFLGNMLRFPDFAQALMERIADLCKTLMGQILQEFDGNVDIIKIGDDLGMQQGLLISPDMYRQMLKPIHADFISFIKARTDAKVFFHSDGDIFDLTEDLVEIGVDILNPIQTSAGRMSDLAALKKRYDKEVVFCGAIDTHRILPHGTPEEVRQEVRRVMGLLGPGGGYMVGAVHTIMNDVPAENILAMVDAVEEFGHYPLET